MRDSRFVRLRRPRARDAAYHADARTAGDTYANRYARADRYAYPDANPAHSCAYLHADAGTDSYAHRCTYPDARSADAYADAHPADSYIHAYARDSDADSYAHPADSDADAHSYAHPRSRLAAAGRAFGRGV